MKESIYKGIIKTRLKLFKGAKGNGGKIPSHTRKKSFSFYDMKVPLLAFTIIIVLVLLLFPGFSFHRKNLQVGAVSSKNIKASEDFLIEDKIQTAKRKAEASLSVPPVFNMYSSDLEKKKDLISKVFARLRESKNISIDEQLAIIKNETGVVLSTREITVFRATSFSKEIEGAIKKLLDLAMSNEIIADDSGVELSISSRIMMITPGQEDGVIKDLSTIRTLKQTHALIAKEINSFNLRPVGVKEAALSLVNKMIKPNLIYNNGETEHRRQIVEEKVKPVYYHIKKGEMIVREGERITEEHLVRLMALQKSEEKSKLLFTLMGYAILITMILLPSIVFLQRFRPSIVSNLTNLLTMGAILIIITVVCKLFVFIAGLIGMNISPLGYSAILYATPVASGAILVAILISTPIAVIFSVVVSMIGGIMAGNNLNFAILSFLGGTVASLSISRCVQRSAIIRPSLMVSIVNAMVLLSFDFIDGSIISWKGLFDIIGGISGGLGCAMLASGLLPVLESIFGITTDIKLVELSNLNQPLLRKLMVEAPGTYHHSIVVGSLAEAAAESIKANPLLARVGAYYHDIGKLKKPGYFVENQMSNKSRHDNLSPHMSSLILISHVKDGVELAENEKIPQSIVDIIRQHHGTGLISFFYHKAKEKENPDHEIVPEEVFRYPGPKPHSREAAIVLIADAVEAASRVLPNPTPAKIQGMIQQMINHFIADGQMDDCDITLKDLSQISITFTRVLGGIYHHRIEYPENGFELLEGRAGSYANHDQKPSKEISGRFKNSKKDNQTHIRSIGS